MQKVLDRDHLSLQSCYADADPKPLISMVLPRQQEQKGCRDHEAKWRGLCRRLAAGRRRDL